MDRHLSSVPHLAGTPQDLEQAEWVRDRFLEAGLDETKIVPYEVLLSYPKKESPNKVCLDFDCVFTIHFQQVLAIFNLFPRIAFKKWKIALRLN